MNAPQSRHQPFGLPSTTALVVANMIGAGVFTTSGFSLATLGDRTQVIAAWAVAGGIAMFGAISYGALARRFAESGGEYLFLSRLAHPVLGFLAGWVSLLAGFTGAIAFAASLFESYVLPDSLRPAWIPERGIGVVTILGFGALHAAIPRRGIVAQNLVVIVKLVLVGLFVAYAFAVLPGGAWEGVRIEHQPRSFSPLSFASSLVWISLSYCGFNAAIYIAGEVRDPERTVPRALIAGTGAVTLAYLALNTIFLWAPEPDAISGREDVAAVAAEAIGGAWLSGLVRVVICLALLSSVSGMIVAGPRVYARMARDRMLPRLFDFDIESARGPRRAVLFQSALAAVVVAASTLQQLLEYLSLMLSLSSAASVACVFLLRNTKDGRSASGNDAPSRAIRCAAAVFVVATCSLAVLTVIDRPHQLTGAAATVGSGLLAYAWLSRAARRQPSP